MMTQLAVLIVRVIQVLTLSAAGHAAEAGRSYTPIVGYDDKNGVLVGGAAFLYKEGVGGYHHGLYGASNGRNFHSVTLALQESTAAGLDLDLRSNVARTFDNYYGEGDATSNAGGLRLAQDRGEVSGSALMHVNEQWAVGPSVGIKARRENQVELLKDGTRVEQRAFPNSANAAVGLRAVFDDRDTKMSSTRGGLLGLDVRALPAKLALLDAGQDAWQAQAEWRQFHSMGHGLVLAHRVAGGGSLGEPGYLERYALGGTQELRGFEDNRFRGKQYYCVQEELRVPVWKMVSVATSVDLGDVSDGRLSVARPRKSFQAGIRAGLPPDYGMKARLDFGAGDSGERSMALQFGETF